MQRPIIVKGRLVGPTSVELDEPIHAETVEVEVMIRPVNGAQADRNDAVSDYLQRLPAGTKSKDKIDQMIHSERTSWGDR